MYLAELFLMVSVRIHHSKEIFGIDSSVVYVLTWLIIVLSKKNSVERKWGVGGVCNKKQFSKWWTLFWWSFQTFLRLYLKKTYFYLTDKPEKSAILIKTNTKNTFDQQVFSTKPRLEISSCSVTYTHTRPCLFKHVSELHVVYNHEHNYCSLSSWSCK